MRKLLLFVLSGAMVIGGLYLLGAEIFWSDQIITEFIVGATILIVVGAYLLWVDFIAPAFGITTGEE
jgi:hypothetical protein